MAAVYRRVLDVFPNISEDECTFRVLNCFMEAGIIKPEQVERRNFYGVRIHVDEIEELANMVINDLLANGFDEINPNDKRRRSSINISNSLSSLSAQNSSSSSLKRPSSASKSSTKKKAKGAVKKVSRSVSTYVDENTSEYSSEALQLLANEFVWLSLAEISNILKSHKSYSSTRRYLIDTFSPIFPSVDWDTVDPLHPGLPLATNSMLFQFSDKFELMHVPHPTQRLPMPKTPALAAEVTAIQQILTRDPEEADLLDLTSSTLSLVEVPSTSSVRRSSTPASGARSLAADSFSEEVDNVDRPGNLEIINADPIDKMITACETSPDVQSNSFEDAVESVSKGVSGSAVHVNVSSEGLFGTSPIESDSAGSFPSLVSLMSQAASSDSKNLLPQVTASLDFCPTSGLEWDANERSLDEIDQPDEPAVNSDIRVDGTKLEHHAEESFEPKPNELFDAVTRQDFEAVKRMVEAGGIDVNVRDPLNNTPLYYACGTGNLPLVDFLVKHGALQVPNEGEQSCIHNAAYWGHAHIVQYLASHTNAEVNTTGSLLETPLHMAAWKGHLETVRLLLNLGAERNVIDVEGRFPHDWASTQEIRNLLLNPL